MRTRWPPYISSADSLLRPYWENRGHISIIDDILVYDDRIVIPQWERLDVLRRLHQGHLAIIKCRERAKQLVLWPGMTQQIAEMVRSCHTCRKRVNDVAEPLKPVEFPSRPWEHLGSDLFYYRGRWYLLVVVYYSRYVEVALLEELNTRRVVLHMKSIFARHGIREIRTSDNGPQYASEEFRNFVHEYEFQHVRISPKYPQSNEVAPQERERPLYGFACIQNFTIGEWSIARGAVDWKKVAIHRPNLTKGFTAPVARCNADPVERN